MVFVGGQGGLDVVSDMVLEIVGRMSGRPAESPAALIRRAHCGWSETWPTTDARHSQYVDHHPSACFLTTPQTDCL